VYPGLGFIAISFGKSIKLIGERAIELSGNKAEGPVLGTFGLKPRPFGMNSVNFVLSKRPD
jgi:hypothetical protein